jgi:uncharacterized protein (TIGR02145 family)
MKKILILLAIFTTVATTAQSVGINADGSAANASAILDVQSTIKGFLPPRMTTSERDAIASSTSGLVIFNTTTNGLEFRSSTVWVSLASSSNATAVSYPSILIGTQNWAKENLDVLTYRDGTVIPQVTDATAWAALTTGAWCWYNNDPANGAIYGKLYNWYAVNDPRGLAPSGWHVPTNEEWTALTTLLGGESVAGGKMKTTGATRWRSLNTVNTNESGFSGLPGGHRGKYGAFYDIRYDGDWWIASEDFTKSAGPRKLYYNLGGANKDDANKTYGFSVRCLRD